MWFRCEREKLPFGIKLLFPGRPIHFGQLPDVIFQFDHGKPQDNVAFDGSLNRGGGDRPDVYRIALSSFRDRRAGGLV